MDRYEAQYSFWSSFGVPAYDENSVPDLDDVVFPYLTYQAVAAPFGGDTVVNASIWTRSWSWTAADRLADMIADRLKNGGYVMPYSGGVIWATPESPFAQRMGDPSDDRIKRYVLSVQLHFA